MPRCHQTVKLFLVSLLALFISVLPVYADDFLTGTEDVPLMSALTLLDDETFDFDTEDGRLYFSKAVASVDSKKVLDFYHQTLPQLGWVEEEQGNFVREGDVLRISTTEEQSESKKKTTVVFELVTKSK